MSARGWVLFAALVVLTAVLVLTPPDEGDEGATNGRRGAEVADR